MKLKVPHTLVLLFGMMVFALLLTYILPQGSFQMSENQPGREVVVPGKLRATAAKLMAKSTELVYGPASRFCR
jgi:uncharacterized ion transporter superfamily protein YfcC